MQNDAATGGTATARETISPARTALTRVWDAPTRLFHWMLVVLVATSWWSGATSQPKIHVASGLMVVWLLLFRIYWGFFGSSLSRFSAFVTGPGAVKAYAQTFFSRSASGHLGHNPLGGWSVLVMLVLLLAQVSFGVFSVDIDGLMSGPMSYLMKFRQGRMAAEVHGVIFYFILAAIVLHVLAILFYFFFKKENLVNAMVTGRKAVALNAAAPLTFFGFKRAAIGIILTAVFVWALANGFRF